MPTSSNISKILPDIYQIYRKPLTISPGLIFFRKRFLLGLYKGGSMIFDLRFLMGLYKEGSIIYTHLDHKP